MLLVNALPQILRRSRIGCWQVDEGHFQDHTIWGHLG
jgi:hypothetical protein